MNVHFHPTVIFPYSKYKQMKNKTLSLQQIEVNSFVTQLEENSKQTIDGGTTPLCSLVVSVVATIVTVVYCIPSPPVNPGPDPNHTFDGANECPIFSNHPEFCSPNVVTKYHQYCSSLPYNEPGPCIQPA